MPRYAQVVMGPAGSGKSTYCNTIVKHCESVRRTVRVINMDPAAEHFDYPVHADIRDLIQVDDAMDDESLRFGPNGGLIFCMEFFAKNFDWLEEELDEIEDDYYLFDCPGQIELYTHIPVMKQFVEQLQQWNFRICGVFILDSQFLIEASKFVSGILSALSTMVNLEIPHVNIMSKVDLLSKKAKKELERYLDPDLGHLLEEEMEQEKWGGKFQKLNHAIAGVIDHYSLVQFIPVDVTDTETVADALLQIDLAIQYGEDLEPREMKDPEEKDDDENDIEDYFAQ